VAVKEGFKDSTENCGKVTGEGGRKKGGKLVAKRRCLRTPEMLSEGTGERKKKKAEDYFARKIVPPEGKNSQEEKECFQKTATVELRISVDEERHGKEKSCGEKKGIESSGSTFLRRRQKTGGNNLLSWAITLPYTRRAEESEKDPGPSC